MQYSIVNLNQLDKIVFRLDAEYYHPRCIRLEKELKNYELVSIRDSKGELDCSAFYPSIVPYYNFEGVGIPFLRVNEIQNGLLHLTKDTAFLPKQILDENKSTIAKCYPGDLIIAKGGNSLAKVALLTEDYPLYSVCRDVIVLRTGNIEGFNRYYLWIFLHSNIGKNLLLRTASQTGQPHLTMEAINQLGIPLLSNIFQERFEWLYKSYQELKDLSLHKYHEAQNMLLSELGLSNWQPKHRLTFVKNHSHTQHAERIDAEYFQPKYDEIVAAIKTYPGGWDSLGNLVKIKKCVEPGSEAYLDEGIPFVRVSNLSPFEISEEKYISETLYKELTPKEEKASFETSKNHQPQQDEILFTKDATPGIAYYLHETPPKMIPSGGVLRLKLRDKRVSAEYLTLVLNSLIVKEQITRDVGGSVILHWRPDQVKETLIPILPPEKQQQIQQKITESFNLRKQSKHLLECAKRAVEIAIEENEEVAIAYINEQTSGQNHDNA